MRVVLVTSPGARHARRGLARARRTMRRLGIAIVAELTVGEVERLGDVLSRAGSPPPLVVAAGGDGTVGAVVNAIAETPAILGVLPLGTSNDFARSLGISRRPERAVALWRDGIATTVELGRIHIRDAAPLYFAHAATVGLGVDFARMATRGSLRRRLGRLTYATAAAFAVRNHQPFTCHLACDGRVEDLRLSHLSIVNAPSFGGALGMRMVGVRLDDRRLDVLAVGDLATRRILQAAVYALLRVRRPVDGVQAWQVAELHVSADQPMQIAVDGELRGVLPASFDVAPAALRVIAPFGDVRGRIRAATHGIRGATVRNVAASPDATPVVPWHRTGHDRRPHHLDQRARQPCQRRHPRSAPVERPDRADDGDG